MSRAETEYSLVGQLFGLGRPKNKRVKYLSVKRAHGLGNLICLLPVLDQLRQNGTKIHVVTRADWVQAMMVLRPQFQWDTLANETTIDLDAMTSSLFPQEHRTDEFGRLLDVPGPFPTLKIEIPSSWCDPYQDMRESLVFAPEGGHPSRTWSLSQAQKLMWGIDRKLILIGTDHRVKIPCHHDLRGQTELPQLFGIIKVAAAVVTMDSAVLHIAAALGTPTVAIFGGISPDYRIRPDQRVVVMQSDLACCPCNKNETCNELFPCIQAPTCCEVVDAIDLALHASGRIIQRVHTRCEAMTT